MAVREDHIRDKLADQLALIEDRLSPIRTNYPLPNSEGTSGRVDILARDRYGVFVVVELKRSNKTAREALHEIMKYTELLQRELGVDRSEIRAVIISTHWDELLVPFGHLKRGWSTELRGYQLTLKEDGITPLTATQVTPLNELPERGVTPVHLIIYPRGSVGVATLWRQSIARLREVAADDVVGIVLEHPQHGPLLYLVIGRMVRDDPRTIRLDNLVELVPDNTIEAPEGCALEYRALCYMTSRYDYSQVEIALGNPEKFTGLRLNANCKVQGILRAGIFSLQHEIYTDEVLIGRIVDHIGQSQVRFASSSRPTNHPHWAQFKVNVSNCLRSTADWRDTLIAWIDDMANAFPDKGISCQLYNPSDLMGSLVFGWPDRLDPFLPAIQAKLEVPAPRGKMVRGGLVCTGERLSSFYEAIYSVYPEPLDWVVARNLSVAWEADLELLAALNLRYALFEFSDEHMPMLLELRDGQLARKPSEEPSEYAWPSARPLPQFLSDHASEISSVVDYFRDSCRISQS